MLRVLHLIKTSTGAVWAFRQMRELVRLGLEVHVALPPGGSLVNRYRDSGVVVHPCPAEFPVPRVWETGRIFSEFRRLVAFVRPDLIHSHFVATTLTMRKALGKHHAVPRIFQVPGPLHLEHPFFRRLELATAGSADYWIGSCRRTCELYGEFGVPRDRVACSYYGTNLEDFGRCSAGRLRKELGFEESVRLAGMVAYMYPPRWYLGQVRGLKGHEDLIEATSRCLRSGVDLACVFIGGAWNNAKAYEARVRRHGRRRCKDRAIFLGSRDDVLSLYPDFDVVVHPSHSENVGGAVESLLSGVPTIATSVGGFPDLVRDDETGWLVPPRDPGRLAEAIQKALGDPAHARELARNGQIRARELFDVRRTSEQVLKIYESVLRRQKVA